MAAAPIKRECLRVTIPCNSVRIKNTGLIRGGLKADNEVFIVTEEFYHTVVFEQGWITCDEVSFGAVVGWYGLARQHCGEQEQCGPYDDWNLIGYSEACPSLDKSYDPETPHSP